MEQSQHLEPMHRGNRAKAERVQLVIRALSDRFTGDPFPAMSDHYKEPILEKTDLGQQEFIQVTDKQHGWDSEGRYI
jgi:hypothetical protein